MDALSVETTGIKWLMVFNEFLLFDNQIKRKVLWEIEVPELYGRYFNKGVSLELGEIELNLEFSGKINY